MQIYLHLVAQFVLKFDFKIYIVIFINLCNVGFF